MASRWDSLLERKPVPLLDHLLDEVSKLVAKELSRWPLPVGEVDPQAGEQFAPLLSPESKRPSSEVFREAFRLARWELSREAFAYDDYLRNRRWLARGLCPDDKLALLLISSWLTEQLFGLGEATEGRVKRKHFLECLARIEQRFLTAAPASSP